ncbi:MAG: T9SS type A sorting domain-containing protein [Bacteroidota bacterium]
MRKFQIYTFFISVALLTSVLSGNFAFAQCPGCQVNMTCTVSPAQPKICPDVMPSGTAMQPYSEDISFYLPANFDDPGSGYNVDLDQLDVLSVVGLPYGLSFQTSASPSNIYYPTSNPPASEHGCAKICGTPIAAGQYTITVFVLAHVTVTSLGISQTSNSSFSIPLTILPGTSANAGFTISNPSGCAPMNTNFTTNYISNSNPGFHYTWTFGNGNQSTLETPPTQYYPSAGNYIVHLNTVVDTIGYFLSGITVNAATGCDDAPWSAPDYYFVLRENGTLVYTSAYVDNTDPPVSFSFAPFPMNNTTYSINIWDYDTGLQGGDDDCGTISFNGWDTGTHTLQSGNLIVTYTIDHPVITLDDYDTIKVYATPIVSQIAYQPADTVCNGSSVLLSVNTSGADFYQWYKDTTAILNAVDSFYFATTTGKYYVEASNIHGCRTNSNIKKVTVLPNPPKPTFWIIGNTLNTNVTGYNLQWYYEDSLIAGATGMTYDFTQSGNYFLVSSNFFGCGTSSDTINVTYDNSGMPENQSVTSFKVYPNPSSGRFTVAFDAVMPGNIKVMVTDLLGREIFVEDMGFMSGPVNKEIDLSSFSKSIYLVKLTTENGDLMSKIIIR